MDKNYSFSEPITHIDYRGNQVEGRIVLGLEFSEALKLFPFTFAKENGYFITENEYARFKKGEEITTQGLYESEYKSIESVTHDFIEVERHPEDLISSLVLSIKNGLQLSVRATNVIFTAHNKNEKLYPKDLDNPLKNRFKNCGEKTEKEIRLAISNISLDSICDEVEIEEPDLIGLLYNLLSKGIIDCSVRTSNIIKDAKKNLIHLKKSELNFEFRNKFKNCGLKSEKEIRDLVRVHRLLNVGNDHQYSVCQLTLEYFLAAKVFSEKKYIKSVFCFYPKETTILEIIKTQFEDGLHNDSDLTYCRLSILFDLLISNQEIKYKKIIELTLEDFEIEINKIDPHHADIKDLYDYFIKYINNNQLSENTINRVDDMYISAVNLLSRIDLQDISAYKKLLPASIVKNEKELATIVCRLLSNNKKTLEELGAIYGVTRERIRQLESLAIAKLLKNPSCLCWIVLDMYLLKHHDEIVEQLAQNSGVIGKGEVRMLFECFPNWVKNLLNIQNSYEKYVNQVTIQYNGHFLIKDFFKAEQFNLIINNDNWFSDVRASLSLPYSSSSHIKTIAPFLTDKALSYFKKNRDSLGHKRSIEEICFNIIDFYGYPMKTDEIYSKYIDSVSFPRDIRTVSNVIMNSDKFLIMDRGTYGTYSILPFDEKVVLDIRNKAFEFLTANSSKKYVTSIALCGFLKTQFKPHEFSRYVIYGLLQDDDRFYCHRYGQKIGLSSNFSGEDLVAACEMLVGFLNRFGPLSLRQIQIEANKYGDYHDQTIVTELARNKNIVRLDRGLYGLIGVHIDLERLIIAEFISIVFLINKSRTIHFLLDKVKSYYKSIEYETFVDYLKKDNDIIEIKDDFANLNKLIDIESWISDVVLRFDLPNIRDKLESINNKIHVDNKNDIDSNSIGSSEIIKEIGFDDF